MPALIKMAVIVIALICTVQILWSIQNKYDDNQFGIHQKLYAEPT